MLSAPIISFQHQISHENPLLFIGSCFSEQIGSKAQNNGFDVFVNPGGTIFHPLALAELLSWVLDESDDLAIFQREDVWLSWLASSTVYAMSEADLTIQLKQLREDILQYLQKSSHLFVTFGTAWAYKLKRTQKVVANCHKQAAAHFTKELSDIGDIVESWNHLILTLQALNPQLEIVFTISPVRHSKEGLLENNRSKARLHLALESLLEQKNCAYFPSYELLIDVWRDYSFFKADGVHPNSNAIEQVWAHFLETAANAQTKNIIAEWERIEAAAHHRILFPESAAAKQHSAAVQEKKQAFFKKYPAFKPTQL
ncbi:MAG: hypothetical protein RLZZ65_1162 [Bacteroidota bacterium]|jgi:hypothetical protein